MKRQHPRGISIFVLALLVLGSTPRLRAETDMATVMALTDTRDYTLEVISPYGSPDPAVGTHRYAWRATVNAAVEPTVTVGGRTYVCTGWTGTGSVPASGTTNQTGDFILTELSSSIRWEWSEKRDFEYALPSGWSLVSLPVEPVDGSLETLFPTAISAFVFDGAYQQVTHLEPGRGYWVNMPSGVSQAVSGSPVERLELNLQSRWSLIGVPWGEVTRAAIEQVPADILISVFGFSNIYYQTDALTAGQGYWVNLDASGTLSLEDSDKAPKPLAGAGVDAAPVGGSGTLRVEAGTQSQDLRLGVSPGAVIALPPRPPSGLFDVRLQLDGMEAWQAPHTPEARAYRVLVPREPVRFHWTEPTPGEQPWELVINHQEIPLTGTGSVSADGASDIIEVRSPGSVSSPTFALYHNMPNPFNPETVIPYQLPEGATVRLTIHNLQGQRLRTLVHTEQPAGNHRVVWDGRDERGQPVASGVYLYRLIAGQREAVQRMLLLR